MERDRKADFRTKGEDSNMRILGVERSQGACNHYRVVQPLYKLKQNKLADILTIHPQNAENYDFVLDKIMEAEIIFCQRPADDSWYNLIKSAQKAGKIIVVDYDDNPFETSPWNPSYKYYGTEERFYKFDDGREVALWADGENGFDIETNIRRRDLFRAAFKKSDMVTCTTPILADTFKKINPNVKVLPNLIDFDMWTQEHEFKKNKIRIGWQGGASHYEDLYMVAPAIREIIKKHKNVTFVFFGDMRFHGLFKDLPQDQIEWHSWVQHVAYPYKMQTLNLDIGICPLIDNVFNRNKSAIKYYEYSAINVPTVASDISPYSEVIDDGKDGLLVKDGEWVLALEGLIKDTGARNKMAQLAYDNVRENHNADTKAHLWHDAFQDVMKRDGEILEV